MFYFPAVVCVSLDADTRATYIHTRVSDVIGASTIAPGYLGCGLINCKNSDSKCAGRNVPDATSTFQVTRLHMQGKVAPKGHFVWILIVINY